MRAAIVGVAGERLTDTERRLIERANPAGFILFRRNCGAPRQVQALVRELRRLVGRADAPVLIDQEGGRVVRLCPPAWPARCAVRPIGRVAEAQPDLAQRGAWLHARLIAADLEPLGITVVCAPVLDLGLAGQTDAIGDRAYGANPERVALLGAAAIAGFLAGGVVPVIKHLPGHGRANVDSHLALPVVDADRATLAATDWLPFIANRTAPLGMSAHVLFPALDPNAPATLSKVIIRDVIRGRIGFEGALFSDDLSMQALAGGLGDRAAGALAAGCDLALHCNGRLDEMAAVLEAAGPLEGSALARVERGLNVRPPPAPFDRAAGERELAAILATPGAGATTGSGWIS